MSRSGVLSAILLTAAMVLSLAQTQAIDGSVRGRVTDPAGAAVPAAMVTVNNIATGFTRDTQSNDEGYFVIPNLPMAAPDRNPGGLVTR
jgi:Carboxypeptidase regulatory-like domain